jgi:hypothetical protein
MANRRSTASGDNHTVQGFDRLEMTVPGNKGAADFHTASGDPNIVDGYFFSIIDELEIQESVFAGHVLQEKLFPLIFHGFRDILSSTTDAHRGALCFSFPVKGRIWYAQK